MITSKFIIRYTNGLYFTEPENAPRYDEFRDMFSSGQVFSKEWAVNELKKLDILRTHSILVVGGWFGTLGVMIKNEFKSTHVVMLDIDPRCEIFLKNIGANAVTEDMYTHDYTEDVVINTACEHISDVKGWLSKLRKNTLVLLQSNDFDTCEGHINCVYTEEQFINQAGLSEVLYSGSLKTPIYTRYMIIGRT